MYVQDGYSPEVQDFHGFSRVYKVLGFPSLRFVCQTIQRSCFCHSLTESIFSTRSFPPLSGYSASECFLPSEAESEFSPVSGSFDSNSQTLSSSVPKRPGRPPGCQEKACRPPKKRLQIGRPAAKKKPPDRPPGCQEKACRPGRKSLQAQPEMPAGPA
jgi:hypothetical protein